MCVNSSPASISLVAYNSNIFSLYIEASRAAMDQNYIESNCIKHINSYTIDNMTTIELYNELIVNRCECIVKDYMPPSKKIPKLENTDLTFNDYNLLLSTKHTGAQLKEIARKQKLRLSGNKMVLLLRIFTFLRLSSLIVKFQKVFRGHMFRQYKKLQGPAFICRQLCTNASDFLSIEDVKDIEHNQFFSYEDTDGFIYGFDIISLYNLILRSGKKVENPYNRNKIPQCVVDNVKKYLKLSRVFGVSVDVDIQNETLDNNGQHSLDTRIMEVFHCIDALGNYSDPQWFLSLSRNYLIRFIRNLHDIWNYRAQLNNETKLLISPPNGNPFRNINMHTLNDVATIEQARSLIIPVMEKFVGGAINQENRSLGAYYVLGALTIVNENAASALPWLFQSFSYN